MKRKEIKKMRKKNENRREEGWEWAMKGQVFWLFVGQEVRMP